MPMMILAEGTVHRPLEDDERAAVWAWFGPMVDSGFMSYGVMSTAGDRIWLVLSSTDVDTATQRLADVPVVRDGSITFSATEVTPVRYR
jgi:hypothetical protein